VFGCAIRSAAEKVQAEDEIESEDRRSRGTLRTAPAISRSASKKFPRRKAGCGLEALGQINLVDIASANISLGTLHQFDELVTGRRSS